MNFRTLIQKSIAELRNNSLATAELDTQVLLKYIIGKDSAFIYSNPDLVLTDAQYSRYRRLIRRRKKGEPVAYLTGRKEFYGNDFLVNKNVLIPRPETEYLVEEGIRFIQNHEARIKNQGNHKDQKFNVLDIGTGSGNVIISIVKTLHDSKFLPAGMHGIIHNSKFSASDISEKALTVAKKNAVKSGLKNLIHFYCSNLFSNNRIPKEYDLILANLPYVPDSDKKYKGKNGILFEPESSIFADKKGSSIIEKFLSESKEKLKRQGRIILELDPRNADILLSVAKQNFPTSKIEIKKDLGGKNRYLTVQE